ncbi:MAG: hypothetical protein K6E71_08825 [Lachnospiraceae bacterium]|nr:hypothetical protein [Lachnospiraceae bacterium]
MKTIKKPLIIVGVMVVLCSILCVVVLLIDSHNKADMGKYRPVEYADLSNAVALVRNRELEDEILQYLKTQYIEDELQAGFGTFDVFTKNGEIIRSDTSTLVDRNSISVLNTFYGVALSNIFHFDYNRKKTETMIRQVLSEYDQSGHGNSLYEYALTEYALVLLILETRYPLTKNEKKTLIESANWGITQIEYDYDDCYTSLILAQFFCEVLKSLGAMPDEESTESIKVYLDQLIQKETCRNTSMLSEISILYDCLELEKPVALANQIQEMRQDLLHHGGYSLSVASEEPDLVTTAKVLRTEECSDKAGLASFLDTMNQDGIIGICDENTVLTSLRFYYYYVKLLCYTE